MLCQSTRLPFDLDGFTDKMSVWSVSRSHL
jgi:hypothetical protein